MLAFKSLRNDCKIIIRKREEVAELFASSFNTSPLDENKKKCFLEFKLENQIDWCTKFINNNNIHLIKSAVVIPSKLS